MRHPRRQTRLIYKSYRARSVLRILPPAQLYYWFPTPVTTAELLAAHTFRLERWRAGADGILATAAQTFLLLIAVQYYAAGPTAKALLASGGSIGMLLSLLVVSMVANSGLRPARVAAMLLSLGAVTMGVVAAIPTPTVFVAGSITAMALLAMTIPLLTQVYQDNYPGHSRGRLFSLTMMIRIGSAAAFAAAAGRVLAADMQWNRWLLLVYSGAFAFSAVCLLRHESKPLTRSGHASPLRALRLVREDRIFRLNLIVWMLMGFANLMMAPMRVEFLANPRYGPPLAATSIALLTGVIPNIVKLLLSPLWGRLFDRMEFLSMRATLNLSFALGILAFFTSREMPGLLAGAVIFGIAMAGGELAWSLWVTKFSPPERVAEYMSVHTFFTGLRGVGAPLVAFNLLTYISIGALSWVCAAMIVAASLILVAEVRGRKAADPGTTLIEEATRP